jgi:hypothetical protein
MRRLNCIDAASDIVLSVSGGPVPASILFNLLMMSIQCSKHVEECNKYIVK